MPPSATLMLVEDSLDDYEAFSRSLKRNHIRNPLRWCRSGQEALDYLYREGAFASATGLEPPDLILLDLNLPGLDGRDLLGMIKGDAALRVIPVIILTTSADAADINTCYAMGANAFVQKPVHLDALTEAVGRMKAYWFDIAILPVQAALP